MLTAERFTAAARPRQGPEGPGAPRLDAAALPQHFSPGCRGREWRPVSPVPRLADGQRVGACGGQGQERGRGDDNVVLNHN